MYCYATNIGKKRLRNEDAIVVDEVNKVLVLADGMGGHSCGDVASNLAITVAFTSILQGLSLIRRASDESVIEVLINAAFTANNSIISRATDNPECVGMGTTLVEAVIIKNKLYLCNIGDSKCFIVRSKVVQLTEDHTVANLLKRSGTSPFNIPENAKHALTQAIGLNEILFPATRIMPLKKNDLLLYCTDGLTDMVRTEHIAEILHRPTRIEEKVQQLIDAANHAGGMDNITTAIYQHT